VALIGIDVGTSALKALLIDESGQQLAQGREDYAVTTTAHGGFELDSRIVEDAFFRVLTGLATKARGLGVQVRALAMSVSGNEATPVDRAGNALGPTIMSMDARGGDIVGFWEKHYGRAELYELTGIPVHPMHLLVRAMWLREHQPEVFGKAASFLCWGELLALRLGAQPVTDYSMASYTMAFDIRRRCYVPALFEIAGIDPAVFPRAEPTGTPIGIVCDKVADRLGLPHGVTVVTGGFDQAMAALGAGQTTAGQAGVGIGSWEALVVVTGRPHTTPGLLAGGYPAACYVVPERYYTVANNPGGGSVLAWLRDTIGLDELRAERDGTGDSFDLLIAAATDPPSGLLVTPHHAGSYNPWMNPQATGAILGLTLATSRGDLIKGFLEGIVFELRGNITRLESAGLEIAELSASGGGAKSAKWLQLRADITGKPVHTVNVKETGCLAAACVAGAGIGAFDSSTQAVEAFVRPDREFWPDPARAREYDDLYHQYQQVYPSLRGINPHRSDTANP
jgi:xylulokinase